MFFGSFKEINKSISKGMSNIYYKVTIGKIRRSQSFDFLNLKNLSLGQFLRSSNSRKYDEILKFLRNQEFEVWEQKCMWFFYYFNFERNYDVLKSKSPCFLLNKNINFNTNETESKLENPHTPFERRTLCFSSYKSR